MREFEAMVNRRVALFASELANLARLAVREMVEQAFAANSAGRDAPKFTERTEPAGRHRKQGRLTLVRALQEFERSYIARALTEYGGNITHAAASLGVARQVLQRKIQRLNRRRSR